MATHGPSTGVLRRVLLALALLLVWPAAANADGSYVVQPGDTLAAIARQFETSVSALAVANEIENLDLIYVGQELRIPGGESAPPAPTPVLTQGGRAGLTGERSILARRRLVTYYGNPWSAEMGVLGELSKAELVRQLNRQAEVYERVGGKPVQPAIHLIATVAQAGPGADGLYRLRMPADVIEEYADLAAANDMLLILDVQVGLSSVPAEIEVLKPFLRRPQVHLALDPEFDMQPWQRPGVQIGSMSDTNVNYAIRTLAEIADADELPNKILIVHQFDGSMIRNKSAIRDHPRVDVVVDMDGFGGQATKMRHYGWYVQEEPIEFGGIKLFFKQDTDLFSPAEVMGLTPPPDVVIYQ